MKNMKIKVKLIFLFIIVKIIPLLAISYIAYEGVMKLDSYLNTSTNVLFNQSKEIITNTANSSIEDSIKSLDSISQKSLEKISYEIATKVAEFLYERDKDLLFLSKIGLNQQVLENFYHTKNKGITVHSKYYYDEEKNEYRTNEEIKIGKIEELKANLKDNEKEFNYQNPIKFNVKTIPIYKEISYFDLNGKEIYKISSINPDKIDVSTKSNTYVKSENYFEDIKKLEENEIYVSDVIGEYVGTKVIGTFTKEKAQKAGIAFEPENSAYAGIENPLGKRFEGIIRYITPVFENKKKVGYISMALDHRHVREFTDTANPTGSSIKQDIPDARQGNYAFMWDYEGKNISHPRDYSIVGYDKNTGQLSMPWLSVDLADKFYSSNKNINEFLKDYPTFQEQNLNKKPNLKQLKEDGTVGLDCRYLNFAPQCEGWMQVTQDGGYGSFVINWSKVWKLTTAASIPYYTGKYGKTKRGFGFVSIGASVDDFHAAANKTRDDVFNILNNQTKKMESIVIQNQSEIETFIKKLINELSLVTFAMVMLVIFIAIKMSNYIISKINNLLIGTQKFGNNQLDYRIKVSSKDEIGELENSFNKMAIEINNLITTQNELNEHLEEKVDEKTSELLQINQNLEKEVENRTLSLKKALIKAQNADKVKSTFLANMSHEIRTPLNSIIGFSEILSNTNEIDESNRKYASIIEGSAKSLLGIINDILDISKIESGNFDINLKETNIYQMSENIFELFLNRTKDKNIKFLYQIDKNIPNNLLSDGIRIGQVLSNLISNAIKFTPSNGEIDFNVSILKQTSNKVKIRFLIKDNGIGISQNQIKKVFEPFIQVDNESNRKYEGTGLGLSISSHIIKLLNSKIEVYSELNHGSSFWFDLDLEILEDKIDEINKDEAIDNLACSYFGRVLVAEDNKLNQELIKYILNNLKIEFKIVENGQEAVLEYKNGKYDLILMDINMPILDGFEAFKQIRIYEEENNLSPIPISALTANAIKGQKEYFLELGMNNYLTKPININELKELFNLYLNKEKVDKTLYIEAKEDVLLEKEETKINPLIVTYDNNDAITQLGLDESTIDMLLDNFFLTLENDLQNLQNAIDIKDSNQIIQAAHYLKGSCANLIMKDATNVLQEIETKAINAEISFDLKELNLIFEEIRKKI